jgi:hypothetical protein
MTLGNLFIVLSNCESIRIGFINSPSFKYSGKVIQLYDNPEVTKLYSAHVNCIRTDNGTIDIILG